MAVSFRATPKIIQTLIKLIGGCSILALLVQGLCGVPVSEFFTLNHTMLTDWRLWQPVSAFIMYPIVSLGLGPLFDFAFILLFFWFASSEVLFALGERRYVMLVISSTIASAIAGIGAIYLFGSPESFSLLPQVILALVTIWSMCPLRGSFLSMILFPLPPKIVFIIGMLATIGYQACLKNYAQMFAYTASAGVAYLLGIMAWYLDGPFPQLHRFEAPLKRISHKCMLYVNRWKTFFTGSSTSIE